MVELLLGSPIIQVYLLALAAGLILTFWPAGSEPPGEQAGCRVEERGDPTQAREGTTWPAQSLSGMTGGRGLVAIRDIEATCAAEYSTRYGRAIRRIRKWLGDRVLLAVILVWLAVVALLQTG
jgi:hypothetical protein